MFAITYQSPMNRSRSTLLAVGIEGADEQAMSISRPEAAPTRRLTDMV